MSGESKQLIGETRLNGVLCHARLYPISPHAILGVFRPCIIGDEQYRAYGIMDSSYILLGTRL